MGGPKTPVSLNFNLELKENSDVELELKRFAIRKSDISDFGGLPKLD